MKLSAYLEKNEIKQTDFANMVECSQGRIAQLISGDTPSMRLAQRIAAATGGKVALSDWTNQQRAA